MQKELFNSKQIFLFINNVDAFKAEKDITLILDDLAFSDKLVRGNDNIIPLKNLYSRFYEAEDVDELLVEIHIQIRQSCLKHGFGAFDYLILDATHVKFFRGIWHDGYY